MIYIKSFYLTPNNKEIEYLAGEYAKCEDIIGGYMPTMNCYSSYYPFDIFPDKQLEQISFSTPITIFYGGNGSGKTTLLNIIAEKTGIARTALYNKTPFFKPYLQFCEYNLDQEIPKNSMMIASDDVFNYMLNLRAMNQEVDFNREQLFTEYNKVKYGTKRSDLLKVDFEDPKSVEAFDRNMTILKKSKSKFVRHNLIDNPREHSNGESALLYFQEKINDNALYLLDEPENSLSPEKQIQLAEYIEASAMGCNCQFIIATHSPFLLAMKRSKIYDLDACPVTQKKWTELHNIQLYRDFFKKHEKEFNTNL